MRKIVLALLFAIALPLALLAQFENGALSGTVKDSSGGLIVGAQVTVKSVDTSATRTTVTDANGYYNLPSLSPGNYEITVSHPSFGDFSQKATISPGGKNVIDATLEVKGTNMTVEVVDRTETTVDTQTSSINQIINSQQVSQLPSLTRDPYDFVQTLGNVNQDSASGTGGSDQVVRGAGVAMGGQRSSSTDALLDGGENVDLYTSKVGQSVPLDAVQELSVTTSNFSAEYGRAGGGVINVVTKSGTNSFHGGIYEFNRLSALTSNDFESNANDQARQTYTRNQFGYSVGGPIKKEKLFFFSTTEWTRVRSAANVIAVIPDPELLAASAPATQAIFNSYSLRPGLTVLNRLSAADSNVLPSATNPTYAAYVAAGGPVFDTVSYTAPSDAGGGAPQNTYSTFQRIDYNISDKTKLYGRYALLNNNEFAGFINNSPYAGFDTGQTQKNQNLLVSLTRVWTQNLVSETKVNLNRLTLQQPLSSSQPVQPTLYLNANFDVTIQGQLTCLVGYSCTTPGNSIPFGGPQNVMEFAHAFSWTKGKHDFRFGGQYVYTRDNRTFGAYQNAVQALEPGGNGHVNDGVENLMNGNAGWFQVVVDPQGKFPCSKDATGTYVVNDGCSIDLPASQPSFSRNNRYNDFAFYGQDSWKVNRRLTLNLGLRWEYYGVQHNGNPQLDSNFVYGTGSDLFDQLRNGQVYTVGATPNSPASPVGGLWHKDLNNFGPRVGFALDIFGDGKTSLRGGYGIAYERNFGNVTFNVIQNPPGQFNSIFQSAAQPIQSTNLGPFLGTGTKFLPNPSLRYVRQDIPTAYSEGWNLALQRSVLHDSLISIEYTGSHGVDLYSIENLNQLGFGVVYEGTDPVADNSVDRLNRQYGNMNTRGTNGFSFYDALNTRFVTNNLFHSGLAMTVNYTYSHTIDNLSSSFSETPQTENLGLLDPFQPKLDKGTADFDARHRVALSAVWTIPYARGTHGFEKQALDGWELASIFTARTGNPFTVFDSSANIGDTVAARYFVPGGTIIPLSGSSNNVDATGGFAGPNTFQYLTLAAPSATYVDPLVGSGELPTCDMVTNSAGHLVSTGQNCQWPSNMTGRNTFRGPGAYNINAQIMKTFAINERFNLQFRSEFYNLFNHSNYYVQSGATNDVGNTGNTGDFQVIGKRGVNPAAGVPNERRFIQFALRLAF